METQRIFIAISFGSETREQIHAVQQSLVKSGVQARWEESKKLHLTLTFLGDLTKKGISKCMDACRIVSRAEAFSVKCPSLDAFPDWTHPRVLILRAERSPALVHLQSHLLKELWSRGLVLHDAGKPYQPHITLARNVEKINSRSAEKTLALSFHVTETVLFSSTLAGSGSHYTQLASFPLATPHH